MPAVFLVRQGDQLDALGLQDIERDEAGQPPGVQDRGPRRRAAARRCNPSNDGRARLRIPHQQLTVQDQAVRQLLFDGRDEIGEPVLDQ